VLHIGPNAVAANDMLTLQINTIAVTSDNTGLFLSTSAITYHTGAVSAIVSLDSAISVVNQQRSNLGAFTNRLEHAINNIINQEHNNQAAESLIRDVDFATETANFTKTQILTQSATSMLAQANMIPQSVLGLLGK
jgi:flagellin